MILFDAYGVLANSDWVVPHAADAIRHLNQIVKPYFILTNDASALPETRAHRYRSLGLHIEPAQIITSGSLLPDHFRGQGLTGARCVTLGTTDSVRFVESAGGISVPYDAEFDALIIGDQSGFPFIEAANAVLTTLFRLVDSSVSPRLILPNPDLIYPTGQGFGIASGMVAQMFESALELRYPNRQDLRFTRLGKPHRAIFEEAQRRSGTHDMVMIGDTPDTDIRGANQFGIGSALIGTGVATQDLVHLADSDVPSYLMQSLKLLG